MKNIWKLLGIITLSVVLAFSMTACGGDDDPGTQTGNPTTITFGLTAVGSPTTTSVTITFTGGTVSDLAVDQVVVSAGTTSATKGSLTKTSDTVYSIGVTPAGTGNIKIKINKSGVETTERTVNVTKEGDSGGGDPDPALGVAHKLWPSDIKQYALWDDDRPGSGVWEEKGLAVETYKGVKAFSFPANEENTNIMELLFELDEPFDATGFAYFTFDFAADDSATLNNLQNFFLRVRKGGDHGEFGYDWNLRPYYIDPNRNAGYTGEWIKMYVPISLDAIMYEGREGFEASPGATIMSGITSFTPRFAQNLVASEPAKYYLRNFAFENPPAELDLTVFIDGDQFKVANKPASVSGKEGDMFWFDSDGSFNAGGGTPEVEFALRPGNGNVNVSPYDYFIFDISFDSLELVDEFEAFDLWFRGTWSGGDWGFVEFDILALITDALDGEDSISSDDWFTITVPISEAAEMTQTGGDPDLEPLTKLRQIQFRPKGSANLGPIVDDNGTPEDDTDDTITPPTVTGKVYIQNLRLEQIAD
jgi:hypothetical protein